MPNNITSIHRKSRRKENDIFKNKPYSVDFPEQAKYYLRKGLNETETRKVLTISLASWDRFKREHPEFKKALIQGRKEAKSPIKSGPKVILTEEFLLRTYKLALMGLTNTEISDILLISVSTYENYYRDEPEFRNAIKKGRTIADSNVAHSYYQLAVGYSYPDFHISNVKVKDKDGNEKVVTIKTPCMKHFPPSEKAARFWLKNRTRTQETPWQEIVSHEISGTSTPIQHMHKIDLSQLNMQELEILEKMIPKRILESNNSNEEEENKKSVRTK